MKFFKKNSYEIVRLWINQIGIAIFSMVLYTASGLLEFDKASTSLTVKLCVSVFTTLFYLALIYNVCWECGAKDKLSVDSGKAGFFKFKGGLMSVFANVPNFVLSILAVIFIGVYIGGADGFDSAFAGVNLIMRLHESMYLGMIQGFTSGLSGNTDFLVESVLYVVFPFLSIAVCQISYWLGSKEKRLFSFLPTGPKINRE